MKKITLILFISCLFMSVQGCYETSSGEEFKLESISFTEDSYTLLPSKSTSIILNIKYEGRDQFELSGTPLQKLDLNWSTDNDKIAKVNNSGVLEGISIGATTLSVASSNGVIATTQVIVGQAGLSIEKLTFTPSSFYLEKNKSIAISLAIQYKGIDGTVTVTGKALNELTNVSLESENTSIAKISEGELLGVSAGETKIIAKVINSESIKAEASVNVGAGYSLAALSNSLVPSMIFSKNIRLKNNSIMQSFDIDANNDIFYCQIAGGNAFMLNLQKGAPNESANNSLMQIKYFGHGTNIAHEKDGENDYIWVGSYASLRKSDNSYRYSQTVARVKYENGKVINPEDCEEHFYIPGQRNLHPAIDLENDLLAISSHDGTQRYHIYSLSQAKALPIKEVKLAMERTWGGTSGDTNPEVTEYTTAKVRDLSQLKPISEFTVPINANSGSDFGYYASQGFDVSDNMLFYFEGEHNNYVSSQPSNAYVTVLDFNGNVLLARTRVALTDNLKDLQSNSITQIGCIEAEGIKYHNGKLYLGFAARNSEASSDSRYNDIFVFDFSN